MVNGNLNAFYISFYLPVVIMFVENLNLIKRISQLERIMEIHSKIIQNLTMSVPTDKE